jgi:hypothetical protein
MATGGNCSPRISHANPILQQQHRHAAQVIDGTELCTRDAAVPGKGHRAIIFSLHKYYRLR